MSAGLALNEVTAPQFATTAPLTSLPSSTGERFSADFAAAQAPDRYWNILTAQADKADKIIGDLETLTGKKYANPYKLQPTQEELRENLGQPIPVIMAKRAEALRKAAQEAKATVGDVQTPPGYLDFDAIDTQIGQESRALRDKADSLEGTGGGFGSFAGAAAGDMMSPHGVMSAFIPVTRMPLATAESIVGRWAVNVGKEAMFQGAANTAAQAAASVIDYNTRKATGTEQTTEEIVHELLGAFAGGAVLGGAFRGTHLAVRKLMARGVDVPPAVLDAAQVIDSAEQFGKKSNVLGLPPAVHETALDRAVIDVAHGRAANVDDVLQNIRSRTATAIPGEVETGVKFNDPYWQKSNTFASIDDVARHLDPKLFDKYDNLLARRAEYESALKALEGEIPPEKPTGGRVSVLPEVEWRSGRAAELKKLFIQAGQELRDMEPLVSGVYAAAFEPRVGGHLLSPSALPPVREGASTNAPLAEAVRVARKEVARLNEAANVAADAGHTAERDRLFDLADEAKAKVKDAEASLSAADADARAGKMASEPLSNEAPTLLPPEEQGAGRPKTGETPQDKATEHQAKLMIEADEAAGAFKAELEAAAQAEKEARIAINCGMGGIG